MKAGLRDPALDRLRGWDHGRVRRAGIDSCESFGSDGDIGTLSIH
jgi:hypothetical protein